MIEGARIHLNRWQQAAVAVGSAVGALLDPRRADLIAALGETTGKPAFERVLERMKSSPEGRVRLILAAATLLLPISVDRHSKMGGLFMIVELFPTSALYIKCWS